MCQCQNVSIVKDIYIRFALILKIANAQCSGKPLFFPVPVLTDFWPPRIFFVKTQRIRNKPSNFTNFLLHNQIILHKRGGNQSSGSTKSLHWLISFAACSLISGQHGRLNKFCSNMLEIMFFCTFRLPLLCKISISQKLAKVFFVKTQLHNV